jgi:autophagy-related protein 9
MLLYQNSIKNNLYSILNINYSFFQIEHVITVMTICGAVGLMCRSFIPNENMVLCQTFLMRQIVSNIHYAPSKWINDGQSNEICAEFGRIFQLKVQYFVEELLSPIITPFILLFK